MNRKRREKKQAEASGDKPMTLDLKRDGWKIGNLVAQYKTRSDFPTVSEHAFNCQLATYAAAFANASLHDKMERADVLHWGVADIDGWYGEGASIASETHRRLEEYCMRDAAYSIADADYAALEARTMAWWTDQLTRAAVRAVYGIPSVNHDDNKPIEHVDKPEGYATSASRITIAKLTDVG